MTLRVGVHHDVSELPRSTTGVVQLERLAAARLVREQRAWRWRGQLHDALLLVGLCLAGGLLYWTCEQAIARLTALLLRAGIMG